MRQGIGSFRRDSNVLFLNLGNTHFVILYRAVVMICALICICYTSIKKLFKGFKNIHIYLSVVEDYFFNLMMTVHKMLVAYLSFPSFFPAKFPTWTSLKFSDYTS